MPNGWNPALCYIFPLYQYICGLCWESMHFCCAVLSRSIMSDSIWPHGLWPARLLCPWNSPGKNTGRGCHSLLQGIFPNTRVKPRSLALQADSLLPEPSGTLTVKSSLLETSYAIQRIALHLRECSGTKIPRATQCAKKKKIWVQRDVK